MNTELALVFQILTSEDPVASFRQAKELGIAKEVMSTPEGRRSWSYIRQFYNRADAHGEIPSLELFLRNNPTIELPESRDSIHSLANEIQNDHILKGVADAFEEWASQPEDKARESLTTLLDTLTGLRRAMPGRRAKVLSTDLLEDLLNYFDDVDAGINDGMPWPWETFNEGTGGIKPGNFIMIWGLPKSRKTFLLLVIAVHLYLVGYRVYFYSREMMWADIKLRLVAIICAIDYAKITKRKLTVSERFAVVEAIKSLQGQGDAVGQFFFSEGRNPDGSYMTHEDIQEDATKKACHIVIADSGYQIPLANKRNADDNDWRTYSAKSERAKDMAKSSEVPWIFGMQSDIRKVLEASMAGKDLNGLIGLAGYTGMVKDLDLGINVVTDRLRQLSSLRVAAGRESDYPGVVINNKLCEDFSEVPDCQLFGLKEVLDHYTDETAANQREVDPRSRARPRARPRRRSAHEMLAQTAAHTNTRAANGNADLED